MMVITLILLYLLIGGTLCKWTEHETNELMEPVEVLGFVTLWPYLIYKLVKGWRVD